MRKKWNMAITYGISSNIKRNEDIITKKTKRPFKLIFIENNNRELKVLKTLRKKKKTFFSLIFPSFNKY